MKYGGVGSAVTLVLCGVFIPAATYAAIFLPTAHLTVVATTDGGEGLFPVDIKILDGVFLDEYDSFDLQTQAGTASGEATLSFPASTQYLLTEIVPAGWTVASEQCTSDLPGAVFTQETDGILMSVPTGSNITCTLHNTQAPTYCTPGSTPDCNDNVMFLPGIEASRLYGGGVKLWEPAPGTDDTQQLLMNNDGTSVRGDIATKDVIDNAYIYGVGNVYLDFLNEMQGWQTTYGITATTTPYDWRLNLDTIIANGRQLPDGSITYLQPPNPGDDPYLIKTLKQLAATSKTGKVTIIAHSMGGLVAKDLMASLGAASTSQYIDRVIFVASPQVGTPEAFGTLLHGDDQGLPSSILDYAMSPQIAREIASNMPSAYSLLPSQEYFSQVDDPVAAFDPTTLPDFVARYGTSVIHSQGRQDAFLQDTYERVASTSNDLSHPALLNTSLITQAEQLHSKLDNWTPPVGVQVIQIAGWGIPSTAKGFDYASTTKPGFCSALLSCEYGFTMTASTTIDGDGTVVAPSALWVAGTTAQNYWVNLGQYSDKNRPFLGGKNGPFAYSHAFMFEVSPLQTFLQDQVFNPNQSFAPDRYQGYISATSPTSTVNRLRYTLHSPLTLDLYDNQGRHTGISTTTGALEAQIPGTYYMELAGVKYLFTNTNIPTHIVMQGYATSTFSLNVEQLQGDSITASTTWQDMPTTQRTIVTLGTQSDITTLSPLNIDLNGDGVKDYSIAPKPNGTAFLDTVPPEASIGFSTSTKTIAISGTDDQSTTTIATTTTTATIFDATGNYLKLNISKQSSQTNAAALIIPSFSYSTGSSTNATTTLRYFWTADKSGKYTLFISAIKTPTERAISIYTLLLNKTYVVTSTPADDTADLSLQSALLLLRQRTKTFSGLEIPSVFTWQGTMGAGY